MFTLVRSIGLPELLARQLPLVLLCFVIAEAFYKFHSFTLETLAFLATWFVLDFIVDRLTRLTRAGRNLKQR